MSYRERIVRDPQVLGGRPTIKGTRVPVSVILSHLAHEDPLSLILSEFPSITEEDVRAVIAFALTEKEQEPPPPKRVFGAAKGLVIVDESFDDPLPPELLKAFGVEP